MNFDPFTKATKTVYSFYEPITTPTTTSETNIISSMENNNNNNDDISGVVDSTNIGNETKRDDDEVAEEVDSRQPSSQQENDGNNENIVEEAVDHDHSGHSYDEVVEEESVSEEVDEEEEVIIEHAEGEMINEQNKEGMEEHLDHSEEEIIEEHFDHTEEEIMDEHNDGEVIEEHLDHSEEEIIEEHMDHTEEDLIDHSDDEIIEEHVEQVEHVDHSDGVYEEEEFVDDIDEVNDDVAVDEERRISNKGQEGMSEENDDEKNPTTLNESNKDESDILPTNQKIPEENETIENVKDDSGSDEETIEEVEEVEVSDDENDTIEGQQQSSISDNVHDESKISANHEDLEDKNESGDDKPTSENLDDSVKTEDPDGIPLNMHEVKILDDNEDPEDNNEFFSGNSKPSSENLSDSDVTDKAGIKHSDSEVDEALDIESSNADPPEDKLPSVLPPLDSKMPDPLEEDELMTPTTSAFVTPQQVSDDYSTAPLDEIDNNLQVGDEIMNQNVAQHDDNMDTSSLESVSHVVTPVQVSFPPGQPEPSQPITSERPFDEVGDDPTDEGYWRANECATPANGTGKSKKVAPAFRTLSNESTHLKTFDELDDEDISTAPASTTAAYVDSSVAHNSSVASNEIVEDVSDIDLNKPKDAFTTVASPQMRNIIIDSEDEHLATEVADQSTTPDAEESSNEAPVEPEVISNQEPDSELSNEAPPEPEEKSNENPNSALLSEATAEPEQDVEVGESKLGDEKPLESIEVGNNSAKESPLIDSRDDEESTPARDKELLSIDREANESYFSSPFTKGLALLICLLAIALIIALPITMTNNDDDSDREIEIPTMPPTKFSLRTIKPTLAPTLAPIIAAPLPIWSEAVPPINGVVGSGFGSSVSMDSTLLAVGAPLQNEGTVSAFLFDNTTGLWNILSQIVENGTASFGFSIDISNSKMAVGSPQTPMVNTLVQAGSAYVYQYSANQWTRLGSELRGNEDVNAAGEEFGYSVALATENVTGATIVAIGAPRSSIDDVMQRGRVYTFRLLPSSGNLTWESMEQGTSQIRGKSPYDLLGTSVDLSRDGSRLAVGAVGNSSDAIGYVQVYQWSGSSWVLEVEKEGLPGEGFGTSVVMVSDSGDQIAVGSPLFTNESGRLSVFEIRYGQTRQGGSLSELGESIIGTSGERIGDQGSVSAGSINGEIAVAFGSATGVVQTYAYKSEASQWLPIFESLQAGDQSVVIGFSGSNSGSLAAGSPLLDALAIYEAGEPSSTAPTVTQPKTIAPSPAVSIKVTSPSSTAPTEASNVPTSVNTTKWVQTGGNFTPRESNWGFGSSASILLSQISIGAPLAVKNGAVFTYDFNESGTLWSSEAAIQLFGENSGDQFGASVDMANGVLAVGAPQAAAPGTTTAAGAVYCYSKSGSDWAQIGNVVRGDSGIYAAGEQFGSAVAISDSRWLVVGAKGSSLDFVLERGRVYVFRNDIVTSNWTLVQDIAGRDPSGAYGSAVDISSDGSHFIAGSPGAGTGYATIYEWTGSNWTSIWLVEGVEEGEALGSSVKILSSDGSVVAIGSPNYMSGQGRVSVYEKIEGSYVAKGGPILGSPGENIGASGMLSGGLGAPSVILGISNIGQVKRFDFVASSDSWSQMGETVDTGYSALLQVASDPDASQFVVGGNDDAAVYKLV